ncbi:MAG: metal-dependent transcriptional regulator [Lutimonas sp.]|jgi:DtxR family transcriptional regulator, Mn-dependent transcriptional regulator
MASYTEENYLKAIFKLADENGEVSISDLSQFLEVSKPTVNSMAKNLQKNNWVNYEKYKPLRLTPEGKSRAGLIVRKHRLTEMFLVEKMGFSWEEVHEIAEQVEHIQSNALFERMDELLGYPSTDPHGSPIPDKKGSLKQVYRQKLSDGNIGDKLKIVGLTNSSVDFLHFLNSKNLKLGSVLYIKHKEPYDGSETLNLSDNQELILSALVCEQLLVTPV